MRAYRVKTVVAADGRVQLEALPFSAGEMVEIIVLATEPPPKEPPAARPLRGTVLAYDAPTEPVAATDWDVLK